MLYNEQRTTSNERRATNEEQRATSIERQAKNDEQRATKSYHSLFT
ncbi:hypothetical protein H4K35_08475 [Myroides sp. NP-2]|nr:hypothetical protein [Myroides sp. NP-2]MBB1150164.1 hypothetical protein [Myroides sp. NP-2]